MILGIAVVMLVIGILAIVRGRLRVASNRVVVGVPARLLGVLALMPLPAAVVAVFIYLAINAPDDPQQFTRDNERTLDVIKKVVVVAVPALVFGIGAVIGVSPAEAEMLIRRGRHRREADVYDESGRERSPERQEWER
jgi:hypothetical protein